MGGGIIFFSLAGPVGDYTGAPTVIFRGIFSINYEPEGTAKLQRAERGWGTGAGDIIFLGCRIA